MRPTERTRTPTPAAPRPAERMFTKRELLLTTWDQRFAMSPGDQVRFMYERWTEELRLRNAGRSVEHAMIAEGVAAKAGIPDPEKDDGTAPAPTAKPRRPRVPVPA